MRPLRFVGRRLLMAVPSLFAISLVSFLMLRLSPGDPARVIAGPRASAATLQGIREQLGLDRPLWVQYLRYMNRAVHGDFGENLTGSSTVAQVLAGGVGVTSVLILVAAVMTVLACLPLSMLAARRPDGVVDSVVRVGTIGGLALPPFWVGIMLVSYVALPTGWFPVGGWPATTSDQIRAIVLPGLTLAISMAPVLVRSLRASLIEVQNADYVKAGRVMGLRGLSLTRRFVARNAAVSTIPVVATVLGFLIGGTVIIETTFDLPGLGLALVQAAATRDTNVVQGLTLVLGSAVIIIYVAADIALSVIDPRVHVA